MAQVITVTPTQGGWTVQHDVADNPMMFHSGAKAEAAARDLGDALAQRGAAAEIHIYLRDGTFAGRFVCAPPSKASHAAWCN
jgi:hypothetical protein